MGETAAPDASPAAKRQGVWIFIGPRFARVVGPPVGSREVIAGTLCSSLAVLRKMKSKEVDAELSEKYEAILGELEGPGVLKVGQRAGCKATEVNEVFFDESNADIGGIIEQREGLIVHTLAGGGEQCWRIRDMTFNPFSSALVESAVAEETAKVATESSGSSSEEDQEKKVADSQPGGDDEKAEELEADVKAPGEEDQIAETEGKKESSASEEEDQQKEEKRE